MMFVKNVHKNVALNQTTIIIDAEEEVLIASNTTGPPNVTTPAATGFLSLLFGFFVPVFASIAEDVLTTVAMEVLVCCFEPAIYIIKRFLTLAIKLARRQLKLLGAHEQNARITQGLAEQITSLAKVSSIHTATISSLDQLLSESESKAMKTTRDSDAKFAGLAAEKANLLTSVRAIVDPGRVHSPSTNIISLVQTLEDRRKKAIQDLARANNDIEELQRAKDDGQLAEKDKQLSELTTAKETLRQQVADLEKQLSRVVEEAKSAKEAAEKEKKKFQKRLSDAETTAREGRSKREYDSLRDQFDEVLADLRTAQQGLRDQENKSQGLQTDLENADNARREAESQVNTARNSLQLADEKITDLERQASTQNEATQDANEKLEAEKTKTLAVEKEAEAAKKAAEAAEEKARDAEAKNTEIAASTSEIQQQLKKAEDRAQTLEESNQRLTLQLQNTEQALKEAGDATPEVTENVSSDDSIAVINGLRDQLAAATQQASTAFDAGYQQALGSNPRPDVDAQIQEALNNERGQAQITLRDAEARKEETVKEECRRQWALASENFKESARQAAAEIERLNELGRGVEQQLTNTQGQFNEATQKLADSQARVQNQASDMRRLQGRNDSLAAEQSLHQTNVKDLGNLYRDANAKLKTAKEELATAKKDLLNAKAADQVEEIEAMERDLDRARELMEEIADTPMDDKAHYVFEELFALNTAIAAAKLLLDASGPKVDVKVVLEALQGHEVEEDLLNDLSEAERPVLMKQSRMANDLLGALIQELNSGKSVPKDTLLAKVIEPRGDESSRKRKLGDDQGDAPKKRQDTSSMGMGFGLGRSQGPSSLTTDDATDSKEADALSTSQHESPPPVVGEAATPQGQSIDHTHHSSEPSSPSSPTETSSTVNTIPAIWSATQSQFNPYFHPKPTMIPGPAPKAHLTPSEQQEKLTIKDYQDKPTAPAQTSVPFPSESSFGFSFSAPKNISSGILPHVRKYTRLSRTTNTVLSRQRPSPSTAKS